MSDLVTARPWDIAIDLSDNNSVTDWSAVYGAGIRIAFIKIMELPTEAYPSGPKQIAGARDAGIVPIPYAFLRPCDPKVAAKEFASRCDLAAGMPMCLDWEGRASSTCTAGVAEEIGETLALTAKRKPVGYWGIPGSTPAAPTAAMLAWDDWVPRYPVTGVNSFAALPERAQSHPELYWLPRHKDAVLPLFGQYTAQGRVPGISGLVDRSVAFFASIEAALAWCGGGTAAVTAVAPPAPPAVAKIASTTLRLGSAGADVGALQGALVAAGIFVAVDADFGPHTTAAVEAYQRAHGLTADGIAGPQTLTALGLA